jgi:hypothetical protein
MANENEPLSPAAFYLIPQLERLIAHPLATQADLDHWNSEADKVEKTLRDLFPDFELPDLFRHFLADPDIRVRDKGYLEFQHQLISQYIARLRNQIRAHSD